MLPDYADIRALTTAEPDWHDGNGVPRYRPFDPELLGVYDRFAILAEIRCQACDKAMVVGGGWTSYSLREPYRSFDLRELAAGFTYGDPPWHERFPGDVCVVGLSMSSVGERVVGAWERVYVLGSGYRWDRHTEFEGISLRPAWAPQ